MQFFYELFSGDLPFLRYTVLIGLISSIGFGVVGSVVVTRRISSIAGAVGHSVLGGVGLAMFLDRVLKVPYLSPMMGATAAAVISALLIFLVKKYGREREDTIIGVIWALGMSAGLLLIAKTPGYVDLQGFLFGNILLLTREKLILTFTLGAVILTAAAVFFNPLHAVCFDREFARLRGINVELFDLGILILTSLTVVLLVNVVGIVLVIALLTLPAATAGCVCRRFSGMMTGAVLFAALMTTGGIYIGFTFDLPTGPAIVFFAVIVYLAVASAKRMKRRLASPSRTE